jgi:hypothetical protein
MLFPCRKILIYFLIVSKFQVKFNYVQTNSNSNNVAGAPVTADLDCIVNWSASYIIGVTVRFCIFSGTRVHGVTRVDGRTLTVSLCEQTWIPYIRGSVGLSMDILFMTARTDENIIIYYFISHFGRPMSTMDDFTLWT